MTVRTTMTQEDEAHLGPNILDLNFLRSINFPWVDRKEVYPLMSTDQDQLLGPASISRTLGNRLSSLVARYDCHHIRKIALHILASALVGGHLVTSLHYLTFKANILRRNFDTVKTIPWVLLIWFLEVIYFCSSLIAAVDHFLPPGKRPNLSFVKNRNYPTVDVLLPCCKEPTEIPVENIRAALKLNYPSDRLNVLVLDDGNDDDLMAICQTLQAETGGRVRYLRRKKVPGVPHHFKGGNLNFGLEHSDSEYVVMMDADMILHRSFLVRLLPHIVDSPNVSFVQIPQSFYNLPAGDPLNDSCIIGYDKIMVHRDTFGCATCVGTGAVFRREHLNEIGGFQHQSITEDTTTAYALFNQGYKSVYLNEKLQIGLTPWTFEGYIKQRTRWGQGAIQQFKATWRCMLGSNSKLSLLQKTLFFWHTGYYFLSFANIATVGTLIAVLFWDLQLSVGSEEMYRRTVVKLATSIIFWRLSSFFMWLQVPQSTQSRNRDESHFWWMTPYFAKMILTSIFAYKSTFQFIPTSTVDRTVAKQAQSTSASLKHQLGQIKHVYFHLVYTILVVSLVIGKLYTGLVHRSDCRKRYFILGLSFFLLTTCVHMMVPVLHILWPRSFRPNDRKALLKYDEDGVPTFNPKDCLPKWHWSVLLHEAISQAELAFWAVVLRTMQSKKDKEWCREVTS